MPIMTEAADSGARIRTAIPPAVRGCSHRMRVVGSVRSGPGTRLDCEKPLRAVCREGCGYVEHWCCDSYGCGFCGERKRQRLARLVDNGAAMHLGKGMVGYFLTLTGPGQAEHRRWYQGKRPRRRLSCECHLTGMTLGQWNRQESACWNRLRTGLARDRQVIFCGAVEPQKRDVLHRHVLVFVEGVLEHSEVQALAIAAGYGCVLDLEPVRSAAKAARYISKYVTKGANGRAVVPWEILNPETGELLGRRPTYRLWSSSRTWGVTMRGMKAAQAAQARARARYLGELVELLAEDAGGQQDGSESVAFSGTAPP